MLSLVNAANIPIASDCIVSRKKNIRELLYICRQLQQTCESLNGVGLSAVQCGIPLKLFVAQDEGEFRWFANCTYRGGGPKIWAIEGCLSLPGKSYEVGRYNPVTIQGRELFDTGNIYTSIKPLYQIIDWELSRVIQHEIDHQNDILISEIGKELAST